MVAAFDSMNGWPNGFRAIVVGASGGIGAAMVARLTADSRCSCVEALHRRSAVAIDFDDEHSVAAAASSLRERGPYQLIVNAAGLLHEPRFMPEKRLEQLNYRQLMATFKVNTFGPALVLRHFAPLLDRRRAVMGFLSAKVGSIEDNRLGGWYGYRASKAALNMIVKTAAIELARTQPCTIVVALHPGTVDTPLSRPFRGAEVGRSPATAAGELLDVMAGLEPTDSGSFVAYDGQRLPW